MVFDKTIWFPKDLYKFARSFHSLITKKNFCQEKHLSLL